MNNVQLEALQRKAGGRAIHLWDGSRIGAKRLFPRTSFPAGTEHGGWLIDLHSGIAKKINPKAGGKP